MKLKGLKYEWQVQERRPLGVYVAFHIARHTPVLRLAIASCAGWSRSNSRIGRFSSALAHQPFKAQELDLCRCGPADCRQFSLRVSHFAQVANSSTELPGRSTERLRRREPYEPGDPVDFGRHLSRRIFLGVSAWPDFAIC